MYKRNSNVLYYVVNVAFLFMSIASWQIHKQSTSARNASQYALLPNIKYEPIDRPCQRKVAKANLTLKSALISQWIKTKYYSSTWMNHNTMGVASPNARVSNNTTLKHDIQLRSELLLMLWFLRTVIVNYVHCFFFEIEQH